MTPTGQTPALLTEAGRWYRLGYVPLPVAPDATKRPAVNTWTEYQRRMPTPTELAGMFATDSDGLGLVCGAVSGGLEMLEAEGLAVAEDGINRLAKAMADQGAAELWGLVSSGYVERTPSGGVHWYYRVEGGNARGNTKLARRPSTEAELKAAPGAKVKVLFETRGEGGFTVIAPSGGRTHGTGQEWRAAFGSPEEIPTITEAERDTLYMVASTLDAMPALVAPPRPLAVVGGGVRPGDDFNARATWAEILEPHGWTLVHRFGGGLCGWMRPGKRRRGVSATTGRNDGDNLYVFSTSTEFDTERPYSKFSAYATLNHGGDYSAAAKALRADGYGEAPPVSPTTIDHGPPAVGKAAGPTPSGPAVALAEPVPVELLAARYGPTEDGTARALVELHRDRLRYCPERRQWLTWDGCRWQWDGGEYGPWTAARELARGLPEHDGWAAYKKRALSTTGTGGIVRLARSDDRLRVPLGDLDARPYELNTPAGVVNLRTGKLGPADPAALHTRVTPVAPDFDHPGEVWARFLAVTFDGDQALTTYVQRLLGLSLIGTVLEQVLPFCYGSGANGKSTLIDAVMHAVGVGQDGYSVAAPAELLLAKRNAEHPTELASLAGARLVVCSELDEGQRFAEARVKQLTGKDRISARFMRGDFFTYTPTHTPWLVGNHQPEVGTGGPAFWRRLRLVPFTHIVPEADRIADLPEALAAEAPAVLAWLIRGAADYLGKGPEGGLRTPDAVRRATEGYVSEQDTIGAFVAEQCHLAPGADVVRVSVGAFRDAYETFCETTGGVPATAKRLTMELRNRFDVQSVKGTKGARFYAGIALLGGEDSATGQDWWR